MPLKDLTIDKSKAIEELIESIIKPYIRYDPNSKSIFFLPKTEELNNIKKALVYLVALKGWKFIADEPIPFEVKPDTISRNTGIKGNTLRPMLSGLKERKIIIVKSGKYSIPDFNMQQVKSIIEKEATVGLGTRSQKKKAKKQKKKVVEYASPGMSKQQFESLLDSGWFDSKRVINDVKEKLHELGIIVPSTSLPYYLLAAIRDGKLKRKKEDIEGKKIWVYSKK